MGPEFDIFLVRNTNAQHGFFIRCFFFIRLRFGVIEEDYG